MPYIQVRTGKNGFRNSSSADVFGDGPGAENTIFCAENNVLELHVNYQNVGATAIFRLMLFWSTDGLNFYQKYFYTDAASVTTLAAQTIALPTTDVTLTLEVPVHGPFCRVAVNTVSDPQAATAIMAIQALPRLR